MARKKKNPDIDLETGEVLTEATAKVTNIQDKKTEMQKLREENERLQKQIAAIAQENMILRKQARQPETGPLVPKFIDKNTLERLDDPDWYYSALDTQGIRMIMEKKTGKWMRLSRANYMRHYGRIPNDWLVTPIDGNNRNLDINNWVAISKKEFFQNTNYSFESDGESKTEKKVNLDTGELLGEHADE